MGIVRVQFGHAEAAGTGSSIGATVNGMVAGNLAAIYTTVDGASGAITSVTDDLSAAAAPGPNFVVASITQRIAHFYYKNYGGGNRVITANFSAALAFRGIAVVEYSGADTVAPAGPTATNFGTSAAPSTGSVTPLQNGALMFASAIGSATPVAAAPFSEVTTDTVNFADTEDLVQAVAAAQGATWTMTSGNWGAIISAFYPASALGSAPMALQQRMR